MGIKALKRDARRIKLRRYKQCSIMFVLFLIALLVWSIATVVYFDPLCSTGIVHKNNRILPIIDARLQKTNMLIRCNGSYDALLIGSSRPEEFRQEDFLPYRVFNYSLPSIYLDEYQEYIDLFQKYNKNTKVIFLGLDFYGTNLKMHKHARSPSYYKKICNFHSTWRSFLSIDSLKYALKMANGKQDQLSYDRMTFDKLTKMIDREETKKLIQRNTKGFAETFYGDYVYNPDYRKLLQSMKERYKNIRFVVFTTPETTELLQVLVAKGRMRDYERWLEDIVDVFGSVYNFMLPSPLTADINNFFDAQHLYPQKATPLVRSIIGENDPKETGIGYLLTQESIKAHLEKAHKLFEEL